MFIHQFVHTLNYGDAISGEAISIQRLLRAQGIGCDIYSVHAHRKVEKFATNWREFENAFAGKQGSQQAVLLHYSIASPLNDVYSNLDSAPRALLYHNLTPEKWFLPYNARVSADLNKGLQELPGLLEQSNIVLADSTYNKTELEGLGCNSCEVLPLPLDTQKWSLKANPGIAKALSGNKVKNFIHVGRLAPNKCVEDIIKVFYFYHHKINKDSKLWLIGHDVDTEIYSFELRNLVQNLLLKEAVEFVGTLADSELKSFYQNADCYLCMSEHEGFCVPLLEAMYFGLPVIAYNSTAISETIGNAGVLVDEKRHAEIAELLNIVVQDENLRRELAQRGNHRVEQFSEKKFFEALKDKLLEPISRIDSMAGLPSAREARG